MMRYVLYPIGALLVFGLGVGLLMALNVLFSVALAIVFDLTPKDAVGAGQFALLVFVVAGCGAYYAWETRHD